MVSDGGGFVLQSVRIESLEMHAMFKILVGVVVTQVFVKVHQIVYSLMGAFYYMYIIFQ